MHGPYAAVEALAMNRTAPASRRSPFRMPWLALGIALSSFAAAQSAPEPVAAPTNPDLGPRSRPRRQRTCL